MKLLDHDAMHLFPRPSAGLSMKSQDQAEARLRERLGRLADALAEIPSRLAGLLATETDPQGVHDLLDQEFRRALEILTDESERRGNQHVKS